MLRGAVTFGEDFEQKYMKQIFDLNKKEIIQTISYYSRHEGAKATAGADGKYVYSEGPVGTAEAKIEMFYKTIGFYLLGSAVALFRRCANLLILTDHSAATSLPKPLLPRRKFIVHEHATFGLRPRQHTIRLDWVLRAGIYAMVEEAVRITDCDRETLLDDLREVHRRHHDAEHPFSLLEAETIRDLFVRALAEVIAAALDPAFHAFNKGRVEHLKLYPGVRDGLDALAKAGVVLVAHTESRLYSVVDRLTRLDLGSYFTRVYCRERDTTRHPNPDVARGWLSRFPMEKVIELSHHQKKPDPDVLTEICRDEGHGPDQTAYVGDSIARDILMARDAGVVSIWAKYGTSLDGALYERLVRVSHWTADDVSANAICSSKQKTSRRITH